MNLENKVRNILRNTTLDLADKLIEIQKYLPKSEDLGDDYSIWSKMWSAKRSKHAHI